MSHDQHSWHFFSKLDVKRQARLVLSLVLALSLTACLSSGHIEDSTAAAPILFKPKAASVGDWASKELWLNCELDLALSLKDEELKQFKDKIERHVRTRTQVKKLSDGKVQELSIEYLDAQEYSPKFSALRDQAVAKQQYLAQWEEGQVGISRSDGKELNSSERSILTQNFAKLDGARSLFRLLEGQEFVPGRDYSLGKRFAQEFLNIAQNQMDLKQFKLTARDLESSSSRHLEFDVILELVARENGHESKFLLTGFLLADRSSFWPLELNLEGRISVHGSTVLSGQSYDLDGGGACKLRIVNQYISN